MGDPWPPLTFSLTVRRAYGDVLLGLLGDPMRRAIFETLARRPSSVGELAEQLPISRPAVSQHLKALKDGGLVVSHAVGTRRIYRLNPQGVTALRTWLDGVWEHALADFHKFAEHAADEDTANLEHPATTTPIPAIEGKTTVNLSRDRAFAHPLVRGLVATAVPHRIV